MISQIAKHILFAGRGFGVPRPIRTLAVAILWGLFFAGTGGGVAFAQEGGEEEESEDAFDREVRFINHLMDERLFKFADLAVEEMQYAFPDQRNRVEVVEAGIQLRLGRTEQVEELLTRRDLKTDTKAQAILLQLAMTYDGMGQREKALENYQRFLDLSQGKKIEDPDVLRLFAGAGLRLSSILGEQGEYDQAMDVLKVLLDTTESETLERRFTIDAAQNRIDKARASSGNTQKKALDEAKDLTDDLLWGGTDNYWFMAMGQRAWIKYLRGEKTEAIQELRNIRKKSIQIERKLDEIDAPKSEYPRALLRYVEGLMQYEMAEEAMAQNDSRQAKSLAERAAGNFYNAFLKYEGSEYADRSALKFEEIKAWIEDQFGVVIKAKVTNPAIQEKIFRRQLDLADQLADKGELENAEAQILAALNRYPTTRYTPRALDSLSKVWMELDRDPELLSMVGYLAQWHDLLPDNEVPGRAIRRIGDYMAEQNDVFGAEIAYGTLGTRFPDNPNAPRYLYNLGKSAEERGDQTRASEFYGHILELYPTSGLALNVLRIQAEQALRVENYEKAIQRYQQVLERAPAGLQRVNAMYKIADAKLKTGQPEMQKEAVEQLQSIREELEPREGSRYYEGDLAESSRRLSRIVDFRLGQELLIRAGETNDPDVRRQAARALNTFLESYPDAPQAPSVMYNLGRLSLQEGDFNRATELFNELSETYDEHPLGRDALYSLVKAALEEKQIEVAQRAVRRMVEQPESYGPEKLFQVGDLMLENERWDEAADSFKLALDHPESEGNDAMVQRGLIKLGRAARGAERLEDAVDALSRLIEEYPSSSLVFEAGLELSRTYLDMEPPNTEEATAALVESGRILRSRPDPVDQARLGIAEGQLLQAKGEDKRALSKWYGVALQRPENDAEREVVRRAMILAIDEAERQAQAGDTDKWNIVEELAGLFVDYMPMDVRSEEMLGKQTRAESLRPRRRDEN